MTSLPPPSCQGGRDWRDTGQPYGSLRGHSLRVEVSHSLAFPRFVQQSDFFAHQTASLCLLGAWDWLKPLSLQKPQPVQAVSFLLFSRTFLTLLPLPHSALGLGWGHGGRGLPFPVVAKAKVLAVHCPHLSLQSASLLASPPLIRPLGLLQRWPKRSVPEQPASSGRLVKNELMGPHTRTLRSEVWAMGLRNLNSHSFQVFLGIV